MSRKLTSAEKLATDLLRRLYLPRTWPNIATAGAAIEAYAGMNEFTLEFAALAIWRAARTQRYLGVWIDRFWFEDGRYSDSDTVRRLSHGRERELKNWREHLIGEEHTA